MLTARLSVPSTLMFPVLLIGCSTVYRDMPRSEAQTAIPSFRGYQVSRPDLRQAADGLRAWGRLCRNSTASTPRSLRLELADARDQVTASETTLTITPPLRRGRRCGFYSIATDWRVSATQHLHLCAVPYFGSLSAPCFGRSDDETH